MIFSLSFLKISAIYLDLNTIAPNSPICRNAIRYNQLRWYTHKLLLATEKGFLFLELTVLFRPLAGVFARFANSAVFSLVQLSHEPVF